MRLCADENIPGDCIGRLRRDGHDVQWIRDTMPGATDEQVIAYAVAEGRLILTLDKDFGDHVFHRGTKAATGIILLRITKRSALAVADTVSRVVASRGDWEGYFSVVDDRTIRMRALKKG
jgi:predicted nuclease of predicted toxin-antitoxin system